MAQLNSSSSSGSLTSGRVNQKRRTRRAILDAAVSMLDSGELPTVADAADLAEVGRTTAYRYFPSQDQLLLEAALDRDADDLDAGLSSPDAPQDVSARVGLALAAIHSRVTEHEGAFRAILKLSLERAEQSSEDAQVRLLGGRRRQFLEAALLPASDHASELELKRLLDALSILAGVEPFVVLKDVCGVGDPERRQTIEWIAATLVDATLHPRSEVTG